MTDAISSLNDTEDNTLMTDRNTPVVQRRRRLRRYTFLNLG